MRAWLLTVSILTSMTIVFLIQEHISFNLGYLLGAVLIALHFFVIAFYSTRREER